MLALPSWASSPVPLVKLCFSTTTTSKRTASAMPLVNKKRSASSAHLLGRGRALMAAMVTAPPAFCDDDQRKEEMLRRLFEDGWVEEQMLSLLTPVGEADRHGGSFRRRFSGYNLIYRIKFSRT